jgi:hypothetical protein
MCSRTWVSVAFFCLVLAAMRVHASGKESKGARKEKAADQAVTKAAENSPGSVRETWKVSGYGTNVKEAEPLALQEARNKVLDYLAGQSPPFRWKPDLDYVQTNLLKEKQERDANLDIPDMKEVILTVEVTDKTYNDMVEQDKQFRIMERKEVSKERQTLLAKLLAGLLAGLVAVAGYLRLDEATKGYYTTWLRVASVALVATVGAGAWLLL